MKCQHCKRSGFEGWFTLSVTVPAGGIKHKWNMCPRCFKELIIDMINGEGKEKLDNVIRHEEELRKKRGGG